jgi:DNA-binding NarL/FixJ family response regulator
MTARHTSEIAVVLIDPDPIARTGLAGLLDADPRFTLLRAGRAAHEVQLDRLRPDLICCDPRTNGRLHAKAIAEVTVAAPQARICIISAGIEPRFVLETRGPTVLMFLQKGSEASAHVLDLLEIVVHTGSAFVDGPIVERFHERESDRLALQQPSLCAQKLTPRELEILRLHAYGEQVSEIARRFGKDRRTISTHLVNAEKKLGAKTHAELVRLAAEQGLLSSEPDLSVG